MQNNKHKTIMEKLNEILKDLEQGKISADSAEDQVLRLFSVMSRFKINIDKHTHIKGFEMNEKGEVKEGVFQLATNSNLCEPFTDKANPNNDEQ